MEKAIEFDIGKEELKKYLEECLFSIFFVVITNIITKKKRKTN